MLKKFLVKFTVLGSIVFLLTGKALAAITLPTGTGLSNLSVTAIISNIMMWLLMVVGFIAIISFAVSGIMYFTASGDEDMAKNAKKAMTYSIIGVIIALSGYIIIQAVDIMLDGGGYF